MTIQRNTQGMSPSRTDRSVRITLLGALLGALGIFPACMAHGPVPVDLDLSKSKIADQRLYRGTIVPPAETIPVGKIHNWTIEVVTAEGLPVEDARISVDGGMPQHGHGLPTKPRVTRHLGDGRYLVEGMKFNMGGWWVVRFQIDGASGTDSLTFNLVL